MATNAQVIANRSNAQLSTGPRTLDGKQASASNGVTTGLTARKLFIRPNEQPDFDALHAGLRAELQPEGITQALLVDRIIHAAWNLQRCAGLESKLQEEAFARGLDDASEDDELAPKLDRVYRYRRMHESSHRKATAELRLLQNEHVWRREHQDLNDESILVSAAPIMASLRAKSADQAREIRELAAQQLDEFIHAPMPVLTR